MHEHNLHDIKYQHTVFGSYVDKNCHMYAEIIVYQG